MEAALARYGRALTRFEHLLTMTGAREVRQELGWMHEALARALDVLQEHAAGPDPTVDANAVHRAATLCAHSAEMVLYVHQYLRRRDELQVRAWLAEVLNAIHLIEDLSDPPRSAVPTAESAR